MNHFLASISIALLSAVAAAAEAAVFCVTPATDLNAVEQSVASNGQPDQLRLVQGVYNFPTGTTFDVPGDLEIIGGWAPNCVQRSANPSLTILDGGASGTGISAGFFAAGSLRVTGLTFTGFAQVEFGRQAPTPATGPTLVENNLFRFNNGIGLAGNLVIVNTALEGPQGEPRTIVRNNVFRDNAVERTLAIYDTSLTTGLRALVANNTFVDNTPASSVAIRYERGPDTPRVLLYAHNNLVANTGASSDQVQLSANALGEFRNNLLQQCAICGIGSHGNVVAQPRFEDTVFLRPAADSPARNAGHDNGRLGSTDYAGGGRVLEGAVDIGAVEHLPPLFANGFE